MLLLRALQCVFQLLQARQQILAAAGGWQKVSQLVCCRMEAVVVILDSRQQGPAGSGRQSIEARMSVAGRLCARRLICLPSQQPNLYSCNSLAGVLLHRVICARKKMAGKGPAHRCCFRRRRHAACQLPGALLLLHLSLLLLCCRCGCPSRP